MSCSFPCFDGAIGTASVRAPERSDPRLETHVLFVAIPQRSTRARRWALARGIGDVDVAALTAMLRAERLSAG